MKRTPFLPWVLDEKELDTIVLSARERKTLLDAAKVLDKIRALRDSDDDEQGVDIALASYVLRDLVSDEIRVSS